MICGDVYKGATCVESHPRHRSAHRPVSGPTWPQILPRQLHGTIVVELGIRRPSPDDVPVEPSRSTAPEHERAELSKQPPPSGYPPTLPH